MDIFNMKFLKIGLAILIIPFISYFLIRYSIPLLVESILEFVDGRDQSIAEMIFSLLQILIGYYFIHKAIQILRFSVK